MAGHHKRMVSHINNGQRELQRAMRVDLQAEGHRLEAASDNQVCQALSNPTCSSHVAACWRWAEEPA